MGEHGATAAAGGTGEAGVATAPVRLTAYSHGAGCACKLGASELGVVLGSLRPGSHPDLLVGTDTGDDAAVWRRPDGRALVGTVDFFTPVVDDARTWGAIAAANAASDVYAMGGRPLFALNVVAWPQASLPLELLGDVLEGALEVAERGGWLVAGGHTIDGAEPLYGQAVIGECETEALLTNAGGRPGDTLVLTKGIGTGLVTTAVKRLDATALAPGGELVEPYAAAIASMTTLNDEARTAALRAGATAATDVTGFGLVGHLHKLALASGVEAVVEAGAVPLLPGVADLATRGFVPGGTGRNVAFVRRFIDLPEEDLAILADPQTSGGLLVACPADRAAGLVDELRALGHPASRVGELRVGAPGRLLVR
jgi:selenide,water dikinase